VVHDNFGFYKNSIGLAEAHLAQIE
jgi:hypothetical protein